LRSLIRMVVTDMGITGTVDMTMIMEGTRMADTMLMPIETR
jgi:hypothetical protein